MPTEEIAWLRDTFADMDFVTEVEIEGASMVITRRDKPPAHLGFVRAPLLQGNEIDELMRIYPATEFAVNIPRDGHISQSALERADAHGIAVGRVKEAMSALHLEEPRSWVSPEYAFVSRGLLQHSRVRSIERLDDRRIRVVRNGLDDVVVFIGSEYQPSAETVRAALALGPFQIYSATNPNSQPTPEAIGVGEGAGVKVLRWGPTLAALHR